MGPIAWLNRQKRCDHFRARSLALAAGIALSLIFAPLARAHADASDATQLQSFAPVVKKVLPAVVSITVLAKAGAGDRRAPVGESDANPGPLPSFPPGSSLEEFLRKFFEDRGITPRRSTSTPPHTILGSGFIIDANGYIVTNNHVVSDAEKVTVIFQDDTSHPARVVGRDPKTDLALVKVDMDGPVPSVTWGDSDATQVGDWVIAVGNAFGLGGTVSAGIVSARGRDIHAGPYDDFLQIDAPINRGDSGGPTFNLKAEVIGINTAIYSPSGGSVGVAFAIPANRAKPVIEQLKAHGRVSRGWLGVRVQELTPAIAKYLDLASPRGALVADVTKGGPAERAGIQSGDVITSFASQDVAKLRDFTRLVADTPVGQAAKVKVWRKGREITIETTIAEQPEIPEIVSSAREQQPTPPPRVNALGLSLGALTSELRKLLDIPATVKGVVVMQISDSSPFAEIDLQPGDVIVSVDQEPVTTPQDAAAKLKVAQSKRDKGILLQINRGGVSLYVAWSEQHNNG